MRPPTDRSGPRGDGKFRRNSPWFPLWVLAAIAVIALIVLLVVSTPRSPRALELSYTAFLEQVRADNVVSVELDARRVRGAFREGVPEPAVGRYGPRMQSEFVSDLPPVEDARLLPLLEAHGVIVSATSADGSWAPALLVSAIPLLLLGVMTWLLIRPLRSEQRGAVPTESSHARMYGQNRPDTSFADVAGAEHAKIELAEIVDFLRYPAKYYRLGARIPRGVLLVGPPGTGKTLLARAVAGEASVPFFSISASEFVEVYVGLGASRVRDLFEKARQNAPSIVFVDELDAVGRRRGASVGSGNEEREHTLNQLLVEMDGFDPRSQVVVMAATNRPDVLDPALLRPGRFDRQVVVGLPDRKGRAEILRVHSRHLVLAPEADLEALAQSTPGFSGADLANLCNEAALLAARHDRMRVDMDAFHEALDKLMLGTERPRLMDERERRTVAYHEAGHALAASLLSGADPVHRVMIIPHGRSLGATAQLPEQERYSHSRDDLLTKLTVLLAGRAAEELALDELTTGAESDFQEATALAQGMVTRWGMSEAVGVVTYQGAEMSPTSEQEISETTRTLIDQEVHRILADARQRALALLTEQRAALDRLAQALLREETLDAAAIGAVLAA
ncbi:MAG: ATP-dependent zinc metalloprotease FtsH [Anaerolineales bacterium]|nr:ATP-dependent zinc metalloprotease FtsH [Anaerolineales bacterium]